MTKRVSRIKLNSWYHRVVRFTLTASGIDKASEVGKHGESFCVRHRMTLWTNVGVCYTIIRMYSMPLNHTLSAAHMAELDVLYMFNCFLSGPRSLQPDEHGCRPHMWFLCRVRSSRSLLFTSNSVLRRPTRSFSNAKTRPVFPSRRWGAPVLSLGVYI